MSGFAHDIAGGQGNLIITSVQSPNFVHGSAGWQVKKDGSAEFNNLTIRGTFNGNNFILNGSGLFIYSGTPAAGNLIESLAPAAGTDAFGNAYVQGLGVYITISLTKYTLTFGQQNNFPAMSIQQAASSPQLPAIYAANAASSAGCSAYVNSGQSLISSIASVLQVEDSTFSGIANGAIALITGQVQMGSSGACVWDDNNRVLDLPAGGGPFVTGEGYHSMGMPAGLSGSFYVRLEPNNTVRIRAKMSWTATAATTFTLTTSFPSASYYPTAAILVPVAHNGTINTAANQQMARCFISTSGAAQVIVPATTAGATTASIDATYANN